MTPHAGAAPPPHPSAPRDNNNQLPIPRRLAFRRSLRESNLPEDYLEALDAKRRQLDDSIWKYIASKEREYKNYEKELRQQRRAAQGQDGESAGGNGGRKRRSSVEKEKGDGDGSVVPEAVTRVDGVKDRETMDRGSIAGLKDRRASLERDKDFVGVFTPVYLPALSDAPLQDGPAHLERTPSTPEDLLTGSTTSAPHPTSPCSLERTSSDSAVHAKKSTRPSQLVLQHRTSSSGSSADGKLASAMKSPTQRPKRKRVSLAVGDAIVAPSDNVPSSLSVRRGTPSHSRIRQAERAASSPLPMPVAVGDGASVGREARGTAVAAAIMQAEASAVANARMQESVLSPPMVDKNDFAPLLPSASASKSRIDPDGDLFDLEGEEENGPELPPPIIDGEDVSDDDALEDDDDDDNVGVTGRIDSASTSATTSPISTPPHDRYDPAAGLVPTPSNPTQDSAIPYLPSSTPDSSRMPSRPGFRRPSVVHDPVFSGPGYAEAEMEAVEDETYGSSFVRPPSKGSFTGGSLGEGFMELNAERLRAKIGAGAAAGSAMKAKETRREEGARVGSVRS